MKAWLEVVKDREASLEDREAAAEKIIDRKRICDVPHVVMSGLLYAGDETSRELGIKILKGITGKNMGYGADDSVERRKSAIERWWAWIRQNRPKIDKDEAEGGER
jgi:hypothetical protein